MYLSTTLIIDKITGGLDYLRRHYMVAKASADNSTSACRNTSVQAITEDQKKPNVNDRPLNLYITKYYTALACLTLAALLYSSNSMAWQGPLSANEEGRLRQLGFSLTKSADIKSADSRSAPSELGREILLTELVYRKSKKNNNTSVTVDTAKPARIAEMFVFDYATGVTTRYEIDLSTDTILREDDVESIYLPLNNNEQAMATRLVTSDAKIMSAVDEEYLKQFQQPLAELDDLQMKVSIWVPTSANNSDVATQCRTQRCALISLFTSSNFSLSIEPVVNLKQMTVHGQVLR